MKLILIGTDHRLQQSVKPAGKTWTPREGQRFRRLVTYCIGKLGAKAILEEAHLKQEKTAPTLCSSIAKEHGIVWQALALGGPDLSDLLLDPPLAEARRAGVVPYPLAGKYDTRKHGMRESFMFAEIRRCLEDHDCVLAVVGYIHLGVLARMVEDSGVASVEGLLFTYPLVVDEAKA